MKVLELKFDPELLGIFAISVVEDPAIEVDFVNLKNQQNKYNFDSVGIEEQRLLIGPALIPNKMIFRNFEEEEGYVYFSKETVKQLSQHYFIRGFHQSSTVHHDERVDGIVTVESWIVEDSDNDKSNYYGMKVPEGTWMIAQKVSNEEVWEKVKSGEVKGFSIEAELGNFFSEKPLSQEEWAEFNNVMEKFTKIGI